MIEQARYLPVSEYLPHRGNMLLLDRVLDTGPDHVICELLLRPDSTFCRNGRVPVYVGIEYMAQTAGVLIGCQRHSRGLPIKIGFIASVRKFSCQLNGYTAGMTLTIEARQDLFDEENEMGVMSCAIYHAGVPVSKAQIAAYVPQKLDDFLAA